jgi:hypothetical protein
MNLNLCFEFTDGTETFQATFEDMTGIPIPTIEDCICPGEGQYKILSRTFNYSDSGLEIIFNCEPVK